MNTPPDLRDTIAADLRPVRPLAPPFRRALMLAPLAAAIVVAIPSLNSLRLDIGVLGPARGWALSFVQAAVGVAIVGFALRESVPGRALSTRGIVWTFGAGVIAPLAVLFATTQVTLLAPPARGFWRIGMVCFQTSALSALPALIVAEALVARGLPERPVLAGALYGLGCGLMADAGLRLFCEFSAPAHVLTAHAAGIAVTTLAGALLASIVHRRTHI